MNQNSNNMRTRDFGLWVYSKLREEFEIEDWNKEFYIKIAAYFADEETANSKGMDPSKGLAILGPVGTGKTSLLLYLRKIGVLKFVYKTMYELKNSYQIEGPIGIKVYTEGTRKQGQAIIKVGNLFIDDVGAERFTIRFNEHFDLFKEIVHPRYNLFTTHEAKPLLHFTSNSTLDEIAERYDERTKSRIIGLCNILYLPGDAPDLRIELHKQKMLRI